MESNEKNRSSNSNDGNTVEQTTKLNEMNGRLQGDNPRDGDGSAAESGTAAKETAESGLSLAAEQSPGRSSVRTPFTNLSQIDADLALARTLQEQERAYMMLNMNNDVSDYGSWETGSHLHDGDDDFDNPDDVDDDDDDGDDDDDDLSDYGSWETRSDLPDGEDDLDGPNDDDERDGNRVEEDDNGDEVDEYDGTDSDHEGEPLDVHDHGDGEEDNETNIEIDPSAYSSDEAYARALQEAEERDMAARLFALAGLSVRVEHREVHGHNPQDAWEEVDPDELTYEELLALGEVAGTESRGLSADKIASLPSISYKSGSSQNGTSDSCVICRLDYEDGDSLIVLSCKHSYHSECINNWLKINKVCPVCSAEVSASGQS